MPENSDIVKSHSMLYGKDTRLAIATMGDGSLLLSLYGKGFEFDLALEDFTAEDLVKELNFIISRKNNG